MRIRFTCCVPAVLIALLLVPMWQAQGGENRIVKVTDFRKGELFCRGFAVDEPIQVDIHSIGLGLPESRRLIAYSWIIQSGSFEPVWVMDNRNTERVGRRKLLREYDSSVELEPGVYEAYFFAGSPSWIGNVNIKLDGLSDLYQYIIQALENADVEVKDLDVDLDDLENELQELSDDLEELNEDKDSDKGYSYSNSDINDYLLEITSDADDFRLVNCAYSPEDVVAKILEPDHDLYASVGFTLAEAMEVEIKAIGEYSTFNDLFVDHGWLINADTREPVWKMDRRNTRYAGGDSKNRAAVEELDLDPGNYILYYVTDDSHTFDDWNAPPPYNPMAYGIVVTAVSGSDLKYVSKYSDRYSESALISIVKVGDDECIQRPFEVTKDCNVRIYAIGEYSESDDQFADYGWIEKVGDDRVFWEMDRRNTRHAGGASKNRLFDDVVHLDKGLYTLGYLTDGSHSYEDWNAAPPYDQRNYGVTLYGIGDDFDASSIKELRKLPTSSDVLAKITCVGDDADLTETFKLDKPTKVRIYALGEGSDSEMYDYGWIEDANSGQIVWEMTYRKTRDAGGADKNRKVDVDILLDAGSYRVVYISDDSHSFAGWNAERPRDPFHWGITVSKLDGR